MTQAGKLIRFLDLPGDLQAKIKNTIYDYTTCFIGVEEEPNRCAKLLGSGVLVTINGIHGILTADHVIENLPKTGEVGFIIHRDKVPRNFSISAEYLKPIQIARGTVDETGPDLGFIALPNKGLQEFLATKSFYNLSTRTILKDGPEYQTEGFWAFCGYIDEYTTTAQPQRGYDIVKQFQGRMSLVSVVDPPNKKRHENLYISIDYAVDEDMPLKFGGLSGSGLWQIVITEHPNEELVINEINLLGIVFYETNILNGRRSLICNGYKDIYGIAVDTVTNMNGY